MKSTIIQTINLLFFISITNIQSSHAHTSMNGGCKNHCEESYLKNNLEKKIENINDKNQIEDNYSCLAKSLCRG